MELSFAATAAMARGAAGTPHPIVRMGDYEVIPSAAAEREANGELVWYGSAVARRVTDGGGFNAAFDYYNVACASEHEALAFAVQRTGERLSVTFGTGVIDEASSTSIW